ncbi:Uncharacterised protein [Mycobacteroides abscessus]|nr:Uncharacterised protein [Mycobacteroides abscessus]
MTSSPVGSTWGSRPAVISQRDGSSAARTHSPDGVIPTGTTS